MSATARRASGPPRRARERQPLRRRAGRPAALRRPALGDRRLVRPVRRCAGRSWSSAAWRWHGKRPKTRMPGSPRLSCCSAAHCPCSTRTIGREPDPAELRARALEAEQAALGVAGVTNSSGAGASASASTVALATSGGFSGAYRTTGHGCSASVVAGEGATMQRDHAWHSARHLEDLEAAAEIGRRAGEARRRTAQPVAARSPADIRCSSTRVSPRPCSAISRARSAAPSVARKTSFLQDKLGHGVFAPGRNDRRRPAAPARAALAPVRCGRRARSRGGACLRRSAQQLDRRQRLRAAARHRTDRPCGARSRRRAGRVPDQSLHRTRAAQPRGAARRRFPKPCWSSS